MKRIGMTALALLAGLAVGAASARLPAPNDEQKAKAAEAKAKADEAAKNDAERLGKAQDRATDNFRRGKVVKAGAAVKK